MRVGCCCAMSFSSGEEHAHVLATLLECNASA